MPIALPTKITTKMDGAFYVWISQREREREESFFFFFKFLKVFFQYFLTIFFNFLTFSLYFTIFSTYFFLFFSKIGGYLQGNEENGRLAFVYQNTLMLAAHQHFSSLFDLWPNLRMAVLRPFRVPFSLNFICTKSSRCLISNSLCLV